VLAPQGIPAGGEANVPAWELIDSYEDTDTGTIFDYDPGPLTSYDLYMVILWISEQSGSNQTLKATVEGDTSANYNSRCMLGNTSTLGISVWRLGKDQSGYFLANTNQTAIMYIRGTLPVGSDNYPRAYFEGHSFSGMFSTVHELTVAYSKVNQFRIYTSAEATGHLKVYGLNR